MSKLRSELKQTRAFASVGEEAFLALVRTADHLQRELARFLREQAELTPVQYNVLRILRGADEEGHTCSAIAERLVTHDPDVTRLIDRMQRRELVVRNRDSRDRRVVRVQLAPAGREIVDRLDAPLADFNKRTLRGVSASRLKSLIAILDDLRR